MTILSPGNEGTEVVLQDVKVVAKQVHGRDLSDEEAQKVMNALESGLGLVRLYQGGIIDDELGDHGLRSVQQELRGLLGAEEPKAE